MRFCFIGGLAVQRWGEPRETVDVDLTLLTGFGGEDRFVSALLTHFEPRIDDAAAFAQVNRVLLLRAPSGVGLDIAMGGLPFEESAVVRSSLFTFPPAAFRKIAPWARCAQWLPSVISVWRSRVVGFGPPQHDDLADLLDEGGAGPRAHRLGNLVTRVAVGQDLHLDQLMRRQRAINFLHHRVREPALTHLDLGLECMSASLEVGAFARRQ